MISADTSSLSNFFKGTGTADALLVRRALLDESLVLSPVVVAELLSSPKMSESLRKIIADIPVLELKDGFWERVGLNRAVILQTGKKARLADSMIATSCMDHSIAIISSDTDYRHFTEHFGLEVHTG